MYSDDDFNWNHGIALASVGDFKAAEEALCSVQNERYRTDYNYLSSLARFNFTFKHNSQLTFDRQVLHYEQKPTKRLGIVLEAR